MKSLLNIIKGITFSVFILGAITSCMARKDYERPKNVVDEKLFRTDMLPADSTNIADISWKEIFTDPVLQGHISKALENNLDIRIALQSISSAEAYLKQSKAAYQPTVSIGPNYTFQTQSINTQFGQIIGDRRYVNQFDITASIGWEADIWGKLKAQEKAQLATYLGTVAAHKAVKSSLVASIASAYYQLLTFDAQKKIITETIDVREKNLETTKALKISGTVTEVAVQQSEALVFNAKSLLIDIDTQIQSLENTMSLLMGEPSHAIARSTLENQNLPIDLRLGYPTQLLANRPDVMRAEYNLMNAFELTNSAKAQFYPTLKITGSGGLQSVDIDHLFSVNSLFANVVAGLAQPILNKRQIKTNYDVSLANQETAYLNFRKTVLTAGKEVSDAIRVYSVQDSFIELKQKELDAYKKSVDYSQELVNYGMANYLEVLNASVNSLNAELNISNARYNKMKAGVELYQALGGGWK
ncbi:MULTISPECIES: TolC family protein [Chryseobacterium]|jgi:NodT family efflux transporter outer membrane factor (OMF) lipoprotein|uniref:NodT family efflux transporter outer membrane factor (OMF) lipoprotein n=1 Tax=Chryseobacterium rhizosphaerae TaxID=395937 RepID=A0AAE3Y4M8_9FLAO|nr:MULTISPECIES: TolC family protein [Chryseobacterium]MBL3549181.1 TolC family protein [Chryseobacterium sp. KMC2]MDC8100449.1 TolC family protein [Chryseobacterium rhizosphaerae]MDR6525343.1 NodT family efflux transporter outer membrane factor (OMF) lipoprotein [Chryseobacterium rhizosphaerae]MDR6545701.1 NodT family efflux transporter outer membrane factor (OMF) lipoprotein [Chryseobacterium rhizosphaerae]REC74548.1 TolC family protein [Chryseobacterium rhizosphaerae]